MIIGIRFLSKINLPIMIFHRLLIFEFGSYYRKKTVWNMLWHVTSVFKAGNSNRRSIASSSAQQRWVFFEKMVMLSSSIDKFNWIRFVVIQTKYSVVYRPIKCAMQVDQVVDWSMRLYQDWVSRMRDPYRRKHRPLFIFISKLQWRKLIWAFKPNG